MKESVSIDEQLYQIGQIVIVIKMYRLERMTPNFDQQCSLDDYLRHPLSIGEYLLWRSLHESAEKATASAWQPE